MHCLSKYQKNRRGNNSCLMRMNRGNRYISNRKACNNQQSNDKKYKMMVSLVIRFQLCSLKEWGCTASWGVCLDLRWKYYCNSQSVDNWNRFFAVVKCAIWCHSFWTELSLVNSFMFACAKENVGNLLKGLLITLQWFPKRAVPPPGGVEKL